MLDPDHAAAMSLLAKLRAFVSNDLDANERTMFAALVGPGVIAAYAADEVSGFDAGWGAELLPDALAHAITEEGIRVEGLDL